MTRKVNVGSLLIGGGERVKIQSMCTVKTSRTEEVAAQMAALEGAGCDIIRVSVLDEEDAAAIKTLKKLTNMPIVADIHFSAKLAVAAIEAGCDKVRINPGNIGGEEQVKLVADCIKSHGISVRVGSNTGSIEREFLQKYGVSEFSLVESALKSVGLLEKYSVNDIVISVKASSVPLTYRAYKFLASRTNYPLHVGVTEAGTYESAVIKSSAAIGALLLDGIGDTIRVSITGDPVREVYAAKKILQAVGLDKNFADVISCPTCGRCMWDSSGLAEKVAELVKDCKKPLKIAVMGCVVNGPGEAAEADIGIAGSKEYCVIFKKGGDARRIPAADAEREFLKEIKSLIDD
ncbi:MAG TPA: flavodoxin-dependent (E)-4-hydroxy-3-methylbut-2-enyl-diphosphate synthase [Candidatus Coproplasma stercoravium]|nr:flavodoxin-dependent (E)-4-hydroxy-3-methylbut-2-enyl-diphosphate synthase [Candidatus Coproplasma stercoravium]